MNTYETLKAYKYRYDENFEEVFGAVLNDAMNEADRSYQVTGTTVYTLFETYRDYPEVQKIMDEAVQAVVGYDMETLMKRLENALKPESVESMREHAKIDSKV